MASSELTSLFIFTIVYRLMLLHNYIGQLRLLYRVNSLRALYSIKLVVSSLSALESSRASMLSGVSASREATVRTLPTVTAWLSYC